MAKGNDLVVRLQGDSKGLQNALNNAKKGLTEFNSTASNLNNVQQKFEKITNSTAPLNRKIRDIKKAMEELAVSGKATTKEGEQMWQQLSQAAKQYDETLKKIQKDTSSVSSSKGGMDFKNIGSDLASKAGLGGIGNLAAMANPATIAITAVGGTMIAAGKAAADFEVHLDALQALTGMTDEAMKGVNDTALQMSKRFGVAAGDIVDSMGIIGSQAPQLLKDADALAAVTEAATVLSKAAGIDAVESAKAITGVMNQMGVSASEASNIINVLSAAETQGSASVAYLNKAFEKSGTAAASAGMNYVQLASAIEAIAPKFSSADVAGSQLSSTLLKLSMQGNDSFKPAVVGMEQALNNLANAQMDDAQMKALVGESNITMLKSLIQAKDQYVEFTTTLQGTNQAYDAAAMKSDNFAGAMDRLKAGWDAFLITLGQSGIISGIADNIMLVMSALNDVMDIIGDIIKSFEEFGDTGVEGINILEIHLDILTKVLKGIGEVLNVIIRIAAKVFNSITQSAKESAEWIGEKWSELKNKLGDITFIKYIINAFNKIIDAAANMCNQIKKYWNKLKEWLGMKTEAQIDVKVQHTDSNIDNTTVSNGSSNSTSTHNVSGSKSSANKTKTNKTEKAQAEEGSIKALTEQYNKLNEELNNTNVSDERLKKILSEKSIIEEQIRKLKIRNGLEKVKENKQVGYIDQKRNKYNEANSAINQTKSDYANGIINKEQAAASIEKANSILQEIGMKPLELHINDDGTITTAIEEMEAYRQKLEETSQTIGTIGNAFSGLGSAIGGTGGKMIELAGQTMEATAQMIPNIIKLIGAKQSEAMASGTASAASLPFPANLAAMASVIATVVSLFSSIPKGFAEGGIVGGNSLHGDKTWIRANKGELVLSTSQQSRLYNAIKNGNIGGGGVNGNVHFEISGSTLKGVLRNYDSKMNKLK